MLTILSLFGRSPFAPLSSHMEKVRGSVHKLEELFAALQTGHAERLLQIANEIRTLEHEADRTKNDIRNHLPKGIFLPIDRAQFLEILTLQDRIADRCEDIALLVTLKPLQMPSGWRETFFRFLKKNIEAFNAVDEIHREFHDLLESSFGGYEAEKVRGMVERVAFLENQADEIQVDLLRLLFSDEQAFTPATFYLWQKIFETVGQIANLSENLANRIRMTLELK